jgi:2-C-methyl-D-erythritol 2,4-cyclodiphosphate synthase
MIRVGIGYDIHRLAQGKPLVLGGVAIPYELGFVAHSDGDVLCHAIADALLGAAGLPDIGVLFPDTDPAFKDADSLKLLSKVVDVLKEKRSIPVQLDANIIAQRPKLQPYIQAMRTKIAQCLHIPVESVSVKPRTNEEVGPEGRGEAISAQVVLLITTEEP